MTGSLENRPVGLSRTQFDCAREKDDAYWLYVVEYAADSAKARVLRIQNPAANARTFTFDESGAKLPALSLWADQQRLQKARCEIREISEMRSPTSTCERSSPAKRAK